VDVRADRDNGAHLADPIRKRSRTRAILAIAGVAIAGAAATFVLAPKTKPAPAAETAKRADQNTQLVTVFRAEPREFIRTALVSGEVRPVDDVNVHATATGVRISDVLVDIGDTVEKGQALARLDSGVADAQILAAQAQYQEAKIEQARAAEEYARVKPIEDTGALSKEEIETRRAAAAAADARLAAQKAAFEQVKARLQGGYVRAPTAGLIIERNAKVGEVADQKALFRIVGGNRLEVAAAVSEKDIRSLKAGQSAIFTTGDGDKVEATLRRPAVAIDPQKGTGEALFDLPADTTVRTGMYLRGEVELEKDAFIAAPQTAISYATGEPSLFVIKDGKAVLTPVALGARNGNYVAITSGVAEGDKIASSGGAFLLDGDSVRIVEPEAPNSGAIVDVSRN